MKLSTFIQNSRRGIQQRLARYVGVKPVNVSRWKKGMSKPKLEHCKLIEEFTEGKVTYKDFIQE